MQILFILVPAAIIIALLFLGAFFWAVKTGQFDDIETPAYKMLIEDNQLITKNIKD